MTTEYLGASATIQYQEAEASVEDWEFLRLQDTKPGDVPDEYEAELTRGEVVEIFASIFGRGSCDQPDAPDAYTGPAAGETPEEAASEYLQGKYSGRDGAQQLAAEFGLGDLCAPETIDGGDIVRQVYVHASSQWVFDDYNIVAPGSRLSAPRYKEHDIYSKIEFSNVSYAPLYYFVDLDKLNKYLRNPIAYGDIYEWRGSVTDQQGNVIDNPTWKIANGRVYFAGNWSGILIFKRLPIRYHLYDITISGYVDADATRHYTALVSAKAAGLSLVQMEIDEEETAEETKDHCPWLDFDYGDDGTGTAKKTTCGNCDDEDDQDGEPEEPTGQECDTPITAEEYNEECCGGPLVGCLPPCRSITTTVHGPISGEEPDEYCGKTSVVVLMPRDGKPCGRLTKTWETDGDCRDCDGVDALEPDADNPDVVGPGSYVRLIFFGGKHPIKYKVSGNDFYFSGQVKSVELKSNEVIVFAGPESCGSATVTADDGCSQASWDIRSTNGEWVVVEDNLADAISHYQCIIGKYRYTDDWCDDESVPSTCQGTGVQKCEDPPNKPSSWNAIEGNMTEEWRCPQ